MTVKNKGYLQNFFEVYCSPEVKVNMLCFAEVKDLFEVEYKEREGFIVKLPNRKVFFFERKKNVCCKHRECSVSDDYDC
jgi:hypothetical protein